MEKKIRFKDLSYPLKVIVVMGWVNFVMLCIYFLIGFGEGVISTM